MKRVGTRRSNRSTRPHNSLREAVEATCEPLESRWLLSTINWTNRGVPPGIPGVPTDGFASVFGNLANQARGVVDAALTYWARTIANFNYNDGTNTYDMTISMNASPQTTGTGVGANASATGFIGGKPSDGVMGLGWRNIAANGNTAAGWYLDPTPFDSSEFQGTWNNAFSRQPTTVPLGGADMFTAVLHEMGHAIGLATSAQTMAIATDTGTDDTVNTPATTPVSDLWVYHNNNAVWTEYDGGGATGTPSNTGGPQHFAPRGTSTTFNGQTRFGAVALMNARFTSRSIISDLEADCAKWAYDYTVVPPSSFGTFYNTLDGDGTLRIDTTWLNNGSDNGNFTSVSNDVIDIRPNGSNLQVIVNAGNKTRGIDPLGFITSNFPISQVQRITINTGDGNDFVRVFSNPNNVPVSITGGDGTDTLEGHGATNAYDNFVVGSTGSMDATNLDLSTTDQFEEVRMWGEGGDADINVTSLWTGPVQYIGASSTEAVNLRSLASGSPMVMFMSSGNDTVNVQPGNGVGLVASPVTINGGDGNDTVNVAPVNNGFTTLTQPITFNGDNNNDTFVLGSNTVDTIDANLIFNGGGSDGGLGNRVIYNDQFVNYGASYDVAPTIITRVGFIGTHTVTYTNTSGITIHCGSGNDIVVVRNGVTPLVEANGNLGDDDFTRGDGILQAQSGAAFNGGDGIDRITFDDHLNTNNIIWDCRPNQVIYGGIVIQNTTLFESVGVLAGPGVNSITFAQPVGQSMTQNFTIDAGGGGDTFTLGYQGTNVTFLGQIDLKGGAGADVFDVRSVNTSGAGSLSINGGADPNTLNITRPDNLYATLYAGSMLFESFAGSLSFAYSNIHGGSITGNAAHENYYIYSAPGDFFFTFNIASQAGNDAFYCFPNDAGAFSFRNLIINGGADTDTFTYDATGTNNAGKYSFGASSLYIERGSPSNQDNIIFGAGVENITLQGGNGNDTIRVDHYNANQSATGYNLRINGGNGDDLAIMGNGNFPANIVSISALTFDGQAGTNDELRIDNAAATGGFNYTRNNGGVSFDNGSYGIGIGDVATERVVVNAGASNDQLYINHLAAGTRWVVNAGGGYDDFFASIMPTQGSYVAQIFGDLEYNAGAGGGRLRVWHNFGAGARNVHLDNNSINAYPGDNMFTGKIFFSGLTNSASGFAGLELTCGRGPDNVYLQPHPDTTVSVTGGAHGTVGDTLNLALANAQNYVVNGTPTSGSVTSTNLKPLNFSQFENGPVLDAAPPAVANVNFDLAPPGARGTTPHSLKIQFTEDVGAFINSSVLELINSTTSTTIPASDIFMTYDAATFTATFTFDNYPGGLLPDGAYTARILSGLTDAFGNPMPASGYSAFIWSAGTSGNDVYRVTRIPSNQYFAVYLNDDTAPTFASSGVETIKIVLSGGAGDDSLTLDASIGSPMPSKGTEFDGGADNDTVHVIGSTGADTVTIGSINVNLNAGTETHREVEAFNYDGGGGFDTLNVKSGAPTTLIGTQRFAKLSVLGGADVATQPGSNSTIIARQLSVASGALLDFADNDMLVDPVGGNTLSQVQGWINSARNGGTWDGTVGIISTAARDANPRNTTLGAMLGSDFRFVYGQGATFNGEVITDGSILVKYTYYGDADFNGVVNFDDYSRLDNGFSTGKTGWMNGDFDGNGAVNFDDYSLIDLAFNTQSSALRPGTSTLPAGKAGKSVGGRAKI